MKIKCNCLVFARGGKLHSRECPKRQAYEQREPITVEHTTEREAVKAGKQFSEHRAPGTPRSAFASEQRAFCQLHKTKEANGGSGRRTIMGTEQRPEPG